MKSLVRVRAGEGMQVSAVLKLEGWEIREDLSRCVSVY